MKTLKLLFTLVIVMTFINVHSQSQQNINMKVDAVGNSQFIISMTMNAQQWQMWLQSMGNNPAALKREMERGMPSYFLDDFKLEKNDMERSFVLSLNAYGACRVDKRGNWILETDQKNANITELTNRKYILVSSPPEFGGAIQQTFTIELPEEAKNIKREKDAFGKTIFKFQMSNTAGGFNTMLWAGIALLVIGGAWLGSSVIQKKPVV